MDTKDYLIGALVGRFQVHELHEAHHFVIKQVVDNHKKVILFLGVPKTSGTKKNPLDYDTRKRMIQKHYPEITILALPDFGDDLRWSKELDSRIREVHPIGDVLMYGGRDSFIPSYKRGHGTFECKELEEYGTFVSGTEVRKIVSSQVKESSDFRAGVIYHAYNQFPKVHPCVDVAIFNEDGTKVLLARKPNQNGWRFIGGFVHPEDQSYEVTANRNVRRKVGIEVGDIKYVTSMKVDDWRYRSEEDKIHTTLFSCKYVMGRIEPSQDLLEVKWFELNRIRDAWYDLNDKHITGEGMVKEHQELMKILIKNKI